MQWSQHGSYTLNWQGNILLVSYFGTWNDIAVKHLHRDALLLWQAHGEKPWALLSDGRQWESATAEALDAWWLFFEEGLRHGMCAVTDIMPSNFHAMMVSPLAQRASQLTRYTHSHDYDAAIAWLNQQPSISSTQQP